MTEILILNNRNAALGDKYGRRRGGGHKSFQLGRGGDLQLMLTSETNQHQSSFTLLFQFTDINIYNLTPPPI